MELKHLNRIIVLMTFAISMNVLSQMKMADIEDKQFSINLKKENRSIIKILDDANYSVYYILDKRNFEFDKRHRNVDLVNLIFFSKKYNKGILTLFKQSIDHKKKSVYNITLRTGFHDKYMFKPSMIIVDKDFNYEYLMLYHYMPPPPPENGAYKSWIEMQDNKNRCNVIDIDIKGNAIYENIDDLLENISKVPKNISTKKCDPIVYEMDLKDFFPERIVQ